MPTTESGSPGLLTQSVMSGMLVDDSLTLSGSESKDKSPTRSRKGDDDDDYDTLLEVSRAMVDDESNVIQFTTPDGWKSIVKHINPTVTYLPAWFASEGPTDKGKETMSKEGSSSSSQPGLTITPQAAIPILPTPAQVGRDARVDLAAIESIKSPVVFVKQDGDDIDSDQRRMDGRYRALIEESGMADDLLTRLPTIVKPIV